MQEALTEAEDGALTPENASPVAHHADVTEVQALRSHGLRCAAAMHQSAHRVMGLCRGGRPTGDS